MLAKSVEVFNKASNEKFLEFKLGVDNVVQITVEPDLIRVTFETEEEQITKCYMGFSYIFEEKENIEIW